MARRGGWVRSFTRSFGDVACFLKVVLGSAVFNEVTCTVHQPNAHPTLLLFSAMFRTCVEYITLYSNSTRAVSRLQLVWVLVLMKFYTHCSQRKRARVQTFCFVHTNATHDSTKPSACVTDYETTSLGPRGDSLWSVCSLLETKMQNLETAATFFPQILALRQSLLLSEVISLRS